MTKKAAAEHLRQFNLWRRGAEIPMPSPTVIGIAIDTAVKHLRQSARERAKAKADAAYQGHKLAMKMPQSRHKNATNTPR